jgi:hypothetical protein
MHFRGRIRAGAAAAILAAGGAWLALGAAPLAARAADTPNPPAPLFELTTSAGYFYTLNASEEWSAESSFGFTLQAADRGYLRAMPFPDSKPVYRFRAKDRPSYILVADPQERDTLVASGQFTLEGVLGYEAATQHPGTVALHRFHSPKGEWRVALAPDDAAVEAQGFSLEGTLGWAWPSFPQPVHELKTPSGYFYTAYAPESSRAVAVNKFQPVARDVGFLSPTAFPGSAPVYRFKTTALPQYLLVSSPQERDALVAAGYVLEGVAGYDSAGPQAGMVPWFRFHLPNAGWRVSLSATDPALLQLGYVLDGPIGYTWASPPPVQEVSQAPAPAAAGPAATTSGGAASSTTKAAPAAAPGVADVPATATVATAPAPESGRPARPDARLESSPVASVLAAAGGIDRRAPLLLAGLGVLAGLALAVAWTVTRRRRTVPTSWT